MKAQFLLDELITKHPEWLWNDLEDQGFFEIMQAFRFAPEEDQSTVMLAFAIVKEYILRFVSREEKRVLNIVPKDIVYENKLYRSGYSSGIKEYKLRIKKKKTRIEKKYIDIADKFGLDVQTVILIASFVNGYKKTHSETVHWLKKLFAQNKNNSSGDYYRWLSLFIEKLSSQEFAVFYTKQPNLFLENSSARDRVNGEEKKSEVSAVPVPLVLSSLLEKKGQQHIEEKIPEEQRKTVGVKTSLQRAKTKKKLPLAK